MVRRIGSGVGATKLVDALLRIKGFSFDKGVDFAREAINRNRELSIPHTNPAERAQAEKIKTQQLQTIEEFANFLKIVKTLQKKYPPLLANEKKEEYITRTGMKKTSREGLDHFYKRVGQVIKASQEIEKIKQLITISYLPVDKLIQDISKLNHRHPKYDALRQTSLKLMTFKKSASIAIENLNKFDRDKGRVDIFSRASTLGIYREKALGNTRHAKSLEQADDSSSLAEISSLFEDLSPDETAELDSILPSIKASPAPESHVPETPPTEATPSPEPEVDPPTLEVVHSTPEAIPSPAGSIKSSVETTPEHIPNSAPAVLGKLDVDGAIKDFMSSLPETPAAYIEPERILDIVPQLSRVPDLIATTTLKTRNIEREITKAEDRRKAIIVGSAQKQKEGQQESLDLAIKEIELLSIKLSEIEAHTKKTGIIEIISILDKISSLSSSLSSKDIGFVQRKVIESELRKEKVKLHQIFTSLKTNDSRALDFKLFIQAIKEHADDKDGISIFERLANNDFNTLDESFITDLLKVNEIAQTKVKSYTAAIEHKTKERESIRENIEDAEEFIQLANENLDEILNHPLFREMMGERVSDIENISEEIANMEKEIEQHQESLAKSIEALSSQLRDAKQRASEAKEELLTRLEHYQSKAESISKQLEQFPGSLVLQDKLGETEKDILSISSLIDKYTRIQELKEPVTSISGDIITRSKKSTPLAQLQTASSPETQENAARTRPSTK